MNSLRRRLLQLVIPTLAVLVLIYTAFQLLNGEKGIYTWKMLNQQVAGLKVENAGLEADVARLKTQVYRLKPPVDKDYMDELVRRNLPVGGAGEVVILVSASGYAGRVSGTVE
ncbi:MAG: septum formation initiator family protein [Alphaproteobacteria bacterium]